MSKMKLEKGYIFYDEGILDKKFVAYGSFYNIQYSSGSEGCRNILEIRRKDVINKLEDNKIDAIFIMMNPGASEPKINNYSIKTFRPLDIAKQKHLGIPLVLTKPDKTQYQIMRIMELKEWNIVKIINISDIREAKSNEFYTKLNQLKKLDSDCIHSIFSTKRSVELNGIFKNSKDAKVIVAWGVNSKLRFLISKAILNINLVNRIGYAKKGYKRLVGFYYYHPLQRGINKQKQWLSNILNKL